ncbi:ATP-dependent helicase, partial [Filifactor alocis]
MDIAELNREQLDAVQTAGGNMLILAGAGSGKTRVITYRIAYLINHGVSPSNILALTFTNKAANEMKDRLSSILSEEFSPSWIGTFHSICLRILRMNIEKVNYKKEFVIYDTYDQTAIIKDCMKQLNISPKIKPSFFLSKISDFKNRFKSPNECGPDKEKDSSSIQIHEIYDMYQKRLYSANAIDFDDIIFYTVKIL